MDYFNNHLDDDISFTDETFINFRFLAFGGGRLDGLDDAYIYTLSDARENPKIMFPAPLYYLFKKMDKNEDDRISKSEAIEFLRRSLNMIDSNSDCHIDEDELLGLISKLDTATNFGAAFGEKVTQLELSLVLKQFFTIGNFIVSQFVNRVDKNHDGKVTLVEVRSFDDYDIAFKILPVIERLGSSSPALDQLMGYSKEDTWPNFWPYIPYREAVIENCKGAVYISKIDDDPSSEAIIERQYLAGWDIDEETDMVHFAIKSVHPVGDSRWTGIGFSKKPGWINSEFVLGFADSNGTYFARDSFTKPNNPYEPYGPYDDQALKLNETQDIGGLYNITYEDGVTNFVFNRSRGAGHDPDVIFNDYEVIFLTFPVVGKTKWEPGYESGPTIPVFIRSCQIESERPTEMQISLQTLLDMPEYKDEFKYNECFPPESFPSSYFGQ